MLNIKLVAHLKDFVLEINISNNVIKYYVSQTMYIFVIAQANYKLITL